MKDVTVLLMAHQGVPQPALWEAWLELCPPGGTVRLATFAWEPPVQYESAFLRQHDLGLRAETGWGDFNLVKATVACLELVLRRHPETEMVYVVSGMDIPVLHPRVFLNLPCHTHYMPIENSTRPPPALLENPLLHRSWVEHRAHFYICREDATSLVRCVRCDATDDSQRKERHSTCDYWLPPPAPRTMHSCFKLIQPVNMR
jgi:hypothetical protein